MTDQDRASLAALKGHPGWQVLVTMMEAACEKKRLDMVDVDGSDHNAVLFAHAVARSAHEFYQTIIKSVDHQIAEYRSRPSVVVPAEQELQSILTPFPVGLPEEEKRGHPSSNSRH